MIVGIIENVHDQLQYLGTSPDMPRRASSLIWPHHDPERLRQVWAEYDGPKNAPGVDPRTLLEELRRDGTVMWVAERPCNHGDLNPTNVAIEVSATLAKAYIFDAGGVHADVACRDLAYLEVTSLLHQVPPPVGSLVEGCADLYHEGQSPAQYAELPNLVQNTRALVENIRTVAEGRDSRIYALLVLDAALVQIGGLAFGLTGNKVAAPEEAIRLVGLAAQWYGQSRASGAPVERPSK